MIINNSKRKGFKYIFGTGRKIWMAGVPTSNSIQLVFTIDRNRREIWTFFSVSSQNFHINIVSNACHLERLQYANLRTTSLHFEQCLQINRGRQPVRFRSDYDAAFIHFLDYAQEKNTRSLAHNAVKLCWTGRASLTTFGGWYLMRTGDIFGLSITAGKVQHDEKIHTKSLTKYPASL